MLCLVHATASMFVKAVQRVEKMPLFKYARRLSYCSAVCYKSGSPRLAFIAKLSCVLISLISVFFTGGRRLVGGCVQNPLHYRTRQFLLNDCGGSVCWLRHYLSKSKTGR